MKALIFFLCFYGVRAELCQTGWEEFCKGDLSYGCYRAYFTNVTYLRAYSTCAEISSTLLKYDRFDQEEIEFVFNLTKSHTIWQNNGQHPSTCYTVNQFNQTVELKDCGSYHYFVCKTVLFSTKVGYYSSCNLKIETRQVTTSTTKISIETMLPPNLTDTSTETIFSSTAREMSTETTLPSTATETLTETRLPSTTTEMSTESGSPSTTETKTLPLTEVNTTLNQSSVTTVCPCEQVCYIVYDPDDLEIRVQSIKQNLTVDIATLSTTLRKLTCATDPRPSSAYMGYTGAAIMTLLLLVIVIIDCVPGTPK